MSWLNRLALLFAPPSRQTIPSDKAIVRDYLSRSGIEASPEEVSFIMESAKKLPREVWKMPQFASIAAKAGREDVKAAWYEIAKPCNSALACARDLRSAKKSGIDTVKLCAGKIAMGECAMASSLDQTTIPIANAELIPFRQCDRPEQCGCHYQAWLALAGEFGL